MNAKQQSEEYFAELAEHRIKGDANESNAMGTIYPEGEPVESTGRFAATGELEEEEGPKAPISPTVLAPCPSSAGG